MPPTLLGRLTCDARATPVTVSRVIRYLPAVVSAARRRPEHPPDVRPRPPGARRRRAVSSPDVTTIVMTPRSGTARGQLQTILGEAVLPDGRVWQAALLTAIQAVGITPPAARQAVARAVHDQWLTSERVGRHALMTITPESRHRLDEARERFFRFGSSRSWDHRWLLVTFSVPEERRDQRHQVRSRLSWLGLGSLGNGVWISPHTDREEAALNVLNSVDGPIDALAFIATASRAHDPSKVARIAWDLDELRIKYLEFCRTYARRNPVRPAATFGAWIRLITTWRQFPRLDPELPDSLLSPDWPGQKAYDLFQRRYAQWAEPALEYFRALNTC